MKYPTIAKLLRLYIVTLAVRPPFRIGFRSISIRKHSSRKRKAYCEYRSVNALIESILTRSSYAKLLKSGDAERIAAGDLSAVEELHDQDIRQAIEELKRSTIAVEKQNDALRLQQAALSSLVGSESRATQARAKATTEQLRKWDIEQERVSREVYSSFCSIKDIIKHISRSKDSLIVSTIKSWTLNSR